MSTSSTPPFKFTTRAVWVNLRNAAGTEIGTVGNPLVISGTVTVGSVDTELPAAAALADATANPTTTSVGAFPHIFNGATWDRVRGDISNGIDVDVTRVSGNVTVVNGGTFAVQESGAALAAIQLVDDIVATVGAAVPTKGAAIAGTDGANARLIKVDGNGELQVDVLTMPTITETNSAAIAASLSTMDDWDETDRCKVNIIVGQAGVAGGSGVVSATTQRVVLATDVGLPAGTSNIGDVDVVSSVASSFDHGRKSSVGGTAVQITASSITAKFGVVVKAANSNTGTVYVGNSDVTADSADSTDGLELGAGESCMIPVDNANKVYVIGSAASQKVFWAVV